MEHEQRDSYLIPPNFIEGGTLMGGMFKTRNVIEAGILGAAVGLPVMSLGLSLTARIIILCLTALPLVLLALIGVGGSSLSGFILLFFSYLRNRRVLSQDAPARGRDGKELSMLPTWSRGKKSAPDTGEDEAQLKSRSRFQVDLKERKVNQFKTFLDPEEKVRPLNPLADYIPIEKVANGIIYTRDHRYVKLIEVVPVNFLLRSAREQRSIIYSFISCLKIAPVKVQFKVQFKVLTKRADINHHMDTVRRELAQETDERCRQLQEDYLRLIQQLGSREAITRRFFLVFEHEPLPGTKRGQEEAEAIASLQTAARTAANYLRQCGNKVINHENEDEATCEILYNILCRQASNEQPFPQRVKEVLAEYMVAGRPLDTIPSNDFYAPSRIDLTHGRYICIDGVYYAYLLVPSDVYKAQVPAGWLSLLAAKIQRLHIFFSLLIPDMNHEERQLLDDALIRTYAKLGITHENSTLDDPDHPGQYRTMPVLGDLYEVLKESQDTRRLANIINRLVNGSAKTFNQQTNVSLDNKYIVLDISELTGDLLTVGMFVALDFVWDKAKEDRTVEKAIFIDECWQLIGASSNRLAAEFVLEIFKIIRGYGGSAICATQDLNDFFALEDGKYGKGIINNAKTKILLNLEDEEAQRVQTILHLSEAEVMEITHFERGSGLISTNNNNVTVEIKCSQMEKELITTDRRELQELLNRAEGQEAG